MKDVRIPRLGRELDEAELEAVSGGTIRLGTRPIGQTGGSIDLDDWCGTRPPRFPPIPPRGFDRGGLVGQP